MENKQLRDFATRKHLKEILTSNKLTNKKQLQVLSTSGRKNQCTYEPKVKMLANKNKENERKRITDNK